jgi:hypothetical protein
VAFSKVPELIMAGLVAAAVDATDSAAGMKSAAEFNG